MKIKVAVLQYDVPLPTDESFKKLEELIGKAEWMGAKLVVAPETAIGDAGEVMDTGIDYFPRLSELVKKFKVYLVTSYYKKVGKKFFNQGYILNPDGKIVVDHQKLYPAKDEIENIGIVAGGSLQSKKTDIGNLGMLICKDGFNKYSHFLYEKFGQLETDIICIPSWSIGRKEINIQEYVKSLFTYGAFISRSFILLAGNLNKETNSFGRSLIISPINGVIKEASTDKKEILIEELDLDEVKKAREFDSGWQPKKRIV